MRQHHGADGSGDEESRRYFEGQQVAAEDELSQALEISAPCVVRWIMVVSSARALRSNVQWDSSSTFTRIGLPLAGLLAVWAVVDEIRSRRNKKAVATPDEPFDAFAGGHPVPPMPGQIAPSRVMQQPTQGPTQEVTGV